MFHYPLCQPHRLSPRPDFQWSVDDRVASITAEPDTNPTQTEPFHNARDINTTTTRPQRSTNATLYLDRTFHRCYAGGKMSKANGGSSVPTTKSGQVMARFPQIEAWFRAGFKSQQVHQKLVAEGIDISRVLFRHLLSRYGKTETAIRRAMAAEASIVVDPPIRSASTAHPVKKAVQAATEEPAMKATEVLKRKDLGRVQFRPNANPGKEDLV
jgi:hypothetical protein